LFFFFHLGASRKKQPQKAGQRPIPQRGRPQAEGKLTDNMGYRWREGCISPRAEEACKAESASVLAGEMRTANQPKTTSQSLAEKAEGYPVNMVPGEEG
jgi:hypothetical protein